MMFDPLYYFEKAAKAVRGGILAASDNLAFLVSDACRTPDSAAGSPPNSVAVVAPSPKQGSDSPPRDSAIPPGALGGHPNPYQQKDDSFLLNAAADIVEAWVPLVVSGSPGTVWVDQFLHALRDRAAQFAGLEDTYQPDK
jgi:hypothetical protein